MDLASFEGSIDEAEPWGNLSVALKALWYEAKGDWRQAHLLAQSDDGEASAWVHAYLHRVEGDESNAAYWYRRVDKPYCHLSLADEWRDIARALLEVEAA